MLHIIVERPETVLKLHFRTGSGLDIEVPNQMADDQPLLDVRQMLADATPRAVAERLRSLLVVAWEPGSLRLDPALGGEGQGFAEIEWEVGCGPGGDGYGGLGVALLAIGGRDEYGPRGDTYTTRNPVTSNCGSA